MGLEVYEDGVKQVDSVEWWSEVALVYDEMKAYKTKRCIGLKVHRNGVKPANTLKWRSLVASVR